MSKQQLRFLFFFLLTVFILPVRASSKVGNYPYADSSSLNVKLLRENDLRLYLSDKEFKYTSPPLDKSNNFWYRLYHLIKKYWSNLSLLLDAIPFLFRILLWGLIIFFVVIIITKTKLNRIFYTDKEINLSGYEIDDIEETIVDFDKAIQAGIRQKHFRTAIRLLFLKIIHSLDQKNIIRYSKEKTNSDYLKELSNSKYTGSFLSLVNIYNNVWYGLFDISEKEYLDYEKQFKQFFVGLDV